MRLLNSFFSDLSYSCSSSISFSLFSVACCSFQILPQSQATLSYFSCFGIHLELVGCIPCIIFSDCRSFWPLFRYILPKSSPVSCYIPWFVPCNIYSPLWCNYFEKNVPTYLFNLIRQFSATFVDSLSKNFLKSEKNLKVLERQRYRRGLRWKTQISWDK